LADYSMPLIFSSLSDTIGKSAISLSFYFKWRPIMTHHDHAEKMCAVTCCPCHIDLEKVKERSNNPKYICGTCGRVANSEQYVCDPQPIS